MVPFRYRQQSGVIFGCWNRTAAARSGRHMPKAITEITGINSDMVRGKQPTAAPAPWSSPDLIIAHNAGFDRPPPSA